MMLTLLLSRLNTDTGLGYYYLSEGFYWWFASTVTVHQSVYLFIVLIFGISLLVYMAIMHPFKSTAVLIFQSSSLANLVLLSGFLLYAQTQTRNMQILQMTAAGVSTGVIFAQFCGITLHNAIKVCHSRCSDMSRKYNDDQEMNEVNDDFLVDYHDSHEIMDSLSTYQH